MALVTIAVRYPVLALVGKIPLPDSILRALKYVPPAVLTAIIVPAMVFTPDGSLDLRLTNSYLVAGIVAAIIAWRSKNLLLTIILGMGTLWIWQWLLGTLG
jgi:branched-subunit amino acid transport protein